MHIRFAVREDLNTIVDIYNQAIKAGNATADTVLQSLKDKTKWFLKHNTNAWPIYILSVENTIIGWVL